MFLLAGCIDYTEEELSDYITRLSTERGRVQDALCPNLTEDDVVWEVTGVDRPSFHSPLGMLRGQVLSSPVGIDYSNSIAHADHADHKPTNQDV